MNSPVVCCELKSRMRCLEVTDHDDVYANTQYSDNSNKRLSWSGEIERPLLGSNCFRQPRYRIFGWAHFISHTPLFCILYTADAAKTTATSTDPLHWRQGMLPLRGKSYQSWRNFKD